MRYRSVLLVSLGIAFVTTVALRGTGQGPLAEHRSPDFDDAIERHARQSLQAGRQTFRFDTFGDEAFWGTRCICIRRSKAPRSAASAPA